jgi:hypothetical protein
MDPITFQSPGSLLEMQNFRLTTDLINQNLHFLKNPCTIPTHIKNSESWIWLMLSHELDDYTS